MQAYRIPFPNFQNELLTKFLEGALKLTENFQERISNGVLYQEFTDQQNVALSLRYFKTPEITSFKTPEITEFFSSEADTMGSLQNNCSKQQLKITEWLFQVYLKRTLPQMFYSMRNFQKAK